MGGPSAKVGSSAKLGAVVFKASILDYPRGFICQSMFICHVCVLVFKAHMTCQSGNLLLSFGGVFQGCLRHVLGCVEWVTSDITVQC